MARTQAYRQQHEEILVIVRNIEAELVIEKLKKDPNIIIKMFAGLSGKLKIHLAMEDKGLYPMLAHHADEKLRSLGASYSKEMAGITEAYVKFGQDWLNPSSIEKDPSGFIAATRKVFGQLGKRIERENRELYTILEKSA